MSTEYKFLSKINTPEDLRKMPEENLYALAAEIRQRLTDVVSNNGGHLASNLGIVELTMSLHRIFDFTEDRLVFDVGHQCYVHKILTGRNDRFDTLRQKDGITGFPNPKESHTDMFVSGHASTSISSALGLAASARLKGEDRSTIAVIGDGSIGGGMSFEALNHAGHSNEDIIVILNDNEMAIAETVGALSSYLTKLRTEPHYRKLRQELKEKLKNLPVIGEHIDWFMESFISAVKQVVQPGHMFSELGFKYFGPVDGHNIEELEDELKRLKGLKMPRMLHVVTKKGKGFEAAVNDPEKFHSAAPFEVLPDGKLMGKSSGSRSFTAAFSEALLEECEFDNSIIAITAAMPKGTGLDVIAQKFPDRYVDVGICEEHAITYAGGLAKGGSKPVLVLYSTFLQRGYDQIFHDVCLQEDFGVVFAIDRAGVVGSDGPTHHGVFDIAMLRNLPNITLMSPADEDDLKKMLKVSLALNSPVAIRYPRDAVSEEITHTSTLEYGKAEVLREGKDAAIFAYGAMVQPALDAAEMCKTKELDIMVVNLRFAKPLDEELILSVAKKNVPMFSVEDGTVCGGVGSGILELLSENNINIDRFIRLGIPDEFVQHASRKELLSMLKLDGQGIADSVSGAIVKLEAVAQGAWEQS
jgi:1-deoxy-D-xylulose-5-phosphate synthase